MIIFLLNKLRHKCRKGAIMAAKARSIYYQMDTLINNLREEVNSFGGYVDITKSMGIKPYIVRKKDERVGCMSLVRLPVASNVSFRPTISEPFIKGFNDFLDDVCEIIKSGEYKSIVKLRKALDNLYDEKYDKPFTYAPTYIPDEDEYDDDVDYYKGAEFGSRRLLKEINKITENI